MKLNPINLGLSDVTSRSDFLAAHIGYLILQSGQLPDDFGTVDAGNNLAMLDGADGSPRILTQIVLRGPPSYPPNFHFESQSAPFSTKEPSHAF